MQRIILSVEGYRLLSTVGVTNYNFSGSIQAQYFSSYNSKALRGLRFYKPYENSMRHLSISSGSLPQVQSNATPVPNLPAFSRSPGKTLCDDSLKKTNTCKNAQTDQQQNVPDDTEIEISPPKPPKELKTPNSRQQQRNQEAVWGVLQRLDREIVALEKKTPLCVGSIHFSFRRQLKAKQRIKNRIAKLYNDAMYQEALDVCRLFQIQVFFEGETKSAVVKKNRQKLNIG